MKLPLLQNKRAHVLTRGFTLAELIVSIGLFSIVVLIGSTAVVSITQSNQRSHALQVALDNVTGALEDMARNLRVGTTYHCELDPASVSNIDQPKNCVSGGKFLAFEKSNGNPGTPFDQVIYRYNTSRQRIEKSIGVDASNNYIFIPLTSSSVTTSPDDVIIDSLLFYVNGSASSDSVQPKIFITVSGYIGNKPEVKSSFYLQTTISQRVFDIP